MRLNLSVLRRTSWPDAALRAVRAGLGLVWLASLAPSAQAQEAAAPVAAGGGGLSAGALRLRALFDEPASDKGFSYFIGLGQHVQRYEERASLSDVRSQVTTRSPMLVAGALYVLGPDLMFSMDSLSTFAPGRGPERWHAGSNPFNGTPLQDTLLQTNQFSLSTNQVLLAGHRRLLPAAPWFGTAGLGFRNLNFKRFDFHAGVDQVVDLPTDQTVIEDSAEVLLHAGLSLDSEQVRGAPSHHGLRITVATPVWRRVENSQFPLQRYSDSFGGWDLSLEGRYSVAVLPQVHVGGWARAATLQRQRIRVPLADGRTSELPRSRLDSLSWGLELLWKL
ncbi:MAG: hypothetical protein RL223_3161 [Pseudomonadota bacterium]|jgi:hypothetical protein|nr:hypothetical protein [Pseudomonadota bacterium]